MYGYAAAAFVLKPPLRSLPLRILRAPNSCWAETGEGGPEVDNARGLDGGRAVLALVEVDHPDAGAE
eukprot:2936956-Alexandrium_andersonii.AAC.1